NSGTIVALSQQFVIGYHGAYLCMQVKRIASGASEDGERVDRYAACGAEPRGRGDEQERGASLLGAGGGRQFGGVGGVDQWHAEAGEGHAVQWAGDAGVEGWPGVADVAGVDRYVVAVHPGDRVEGESGNGPVEAGRVVPAAAYHQRVPAAHLDPGPRA